MKFNKIFILIILLNYFSLACCGVPIPLISAVISAVSLSFSFVFKDTITCQFSECCSPPWVQFNHTDYEQALQQRVYGQPLLYRLSGAINDHWNNKQPSKALTVALLGPTGTGKNYAVRILTEHLFKRGSRSKFYHLFSATVHFPHARLIDTYADQIHQWVRGNVSVCPQSVFVFDEIDKMPKSLLDRLKPFIDHHEHINGVDYRRAIFIFLSNSGSDLIMRKMVELKRKGADRSSVIGSAEFDHVLSKHVFTDPHSQLKDSALLKHHLISRFVPFLPLERSHVIGCVQDYLRINHANRPATDELIDKIVRQLPFVPTGEAFFASAGCKRVIDKANMVIHDIDID